ncbi:MAG: aminoglycoside phosphotransferase family protein [Steroidobacteraceae bacterium]
MAWFPLDEKGRASLVRERRALQLLHRYCSFSVPRVLHEDVSGWDVRELVAGIVDAVGVHQRLLGDPAFAHALGHELGRILAQQHTRIPRTELAGQWPTVPSWPRPEDLPGLSQVIADAGLQARIKEALRRHAQLTRSVEDPVLAHCDLGPHNMVFDPISGRLVGIFDYGAAVFGDRHHDFKYMVFQLSDEHLLEGALAVYEPLTGITIDRDRIRLLNAIAAIGYLAFRHGHAPEENWCGRTLAMDLSWTHSALDGAGL